ncbi:hypothetical protein CNX70_07015 [Janthinobacterium svalbardensis]|uniref:Uncharacterized protein n=2 Tax=Janthinobacterium svalbardensis TaxID=368607 RepID=A0A290WSW1_9BURK|nr:hypothetical protein CNX70_07015 [Janthinobacterium svalbardensis]
MLFFQAVVPVLHDAALLDGDMDVLATNSVKSWLGEFLLLRGLSRPDGRPLHAYRVTETEYEELHALLLATWRNPQPRPRWAAVFCLFIAECYRREYDAGGDGWSWKTFECRIGARVTFTIAQHAEFTDDGLAGYWKRPIRLRASGRDLLGSLFAEGGLPWMLLQADGHGFGRAIHAGLRNFYRAQTERRTTSDLMSEFLRYLPQVFQNLETSQLLAGIVQQLMHLAETYPLRGHADPSAFLDQTIQGWRATFPIPLDEANGRRLLNDWLKDAEQQRHQRAQEIARTVAFTCAHRLTGALPDWRLRSELVLGESAWFDASVTPLRNTRLELAVFEGDRLLAKGGAVYVQQAESGWKVRFPQPRLEIARRDITAPLSLRLLEDGLAVHAFHFDASAVQYDDVPLVFEPDGSGWKLIGSASCALACAYVRLRIPAGFNVTGDAITHVAGEANGARWIDARSDICCSSDGEVFRIRLGKEADELSFLNVRGHCLPCESSPALVYIGWPRLDLPVDYPLARETLREFVNGQPLATLRVQERVGLIHYSVRTLEGETLLRRSFGVVPADFGITLHPGVPARAVLRHSTGLDVKVINANVTAAAKCSADETTITLNATPGQLPEKLVLKLRRAGRTEGIELRFPYPYQGACFFGADGRPGTPSGLLLDELLGASVVLFSGNSCGQTFELQLELFSTALPHPRPWRRYRLHAGVAPLAVNLFSYQNDIIQMLGVVSEQDAYVRLTVEGNRKLLSMDIRRYHAALTLLDDGAFAIVSAGARQLHSGALVAAMQLADPGKPSLMLKERTGPDEPVGEFEVALEMQQGGPWLIYPLPESPVLFRPRLYIPALVEAAPLVIASLHDAAVAFHPKRAPHVIDEQIVAMTQDFAHSGWQYLADLRRHFAHLPLSTFLPWQSLAANPEAVAVAVFRLELDTAFCERIRDELALIWESIPLPLWVKIYGLIRDWLLNNGLPDSYQSNLLANRTAALSTVVPGFDQFGPYLETGERRSLPKVPPLEFILPDWYQTLRRTHSGNLDWPSMLGERLKDWMQHREPAFSREITSLSNANFTDAVTYLPIFLAHVTSGKATLDELSDDPLTLRFALKLIADFDRALWYNPVYALLVSYLTRQ